MITTIALLIIAPAACMVRKPPFTLFPDADPNFAYVYLSLPVGTDQAYTNQVMKDLEGRVNKVLDIDPATGKTNPLVQSVISNVTVNAVDPTANEIGDFPNKGKITVAFVEYAARHGVSTWDYLSKIRAVVKNVPGAEVTVDKESGGPPTQKPIAIEITGDNLDSLISTSEQLKKYLDNKQIPGVEKLGSDFQANKPEITYNLDRERMDHEGITTSTVAYDLRTAIFGTEISRFRDANDDYPIYVRINKEERKDVDALRNMPILYRDMGMGGVMREVPLSAFATISYTNTYGGIKRKDEKRIITLLSNLTAAYQNNGNEVVAAVQKEIDKFHVPSGVMVRMAGEQEDQKETGSFLGTAMLISMMLIFLILVLQFNSFSRTLIILSEVLFSVTGVFLGYAIFGNTFSLVMSGIGIVALAGIVVRNGILLVEFMDLMLAEGMSPYDAIIESGRTRMTPVLLTATAAILGLIPLAVGMNVDFGSLLSTGNPHLYFGGDNTAFWAPLAWTMIYGLGFATFLTLIVVPVMCLLSFRFKAWVGKVTGWKIRQ
jgi:multidrug efflux pump subunit AcrB